MKRLVSIVLLMLGCSMLLWGCSGAKEPQKATVPTVNLDNKKIVMVVAQKDFADTELKVPRQLLEATGAKVVVASEDGAEATGMGGTKVTPNLKIKDIAIDEYDAILVVGGSGASTYLWGDVNLHKVLQTAVTSNKYVGAICAAPGALAQAGILKGKEATCFNSPDVITQLENGGATYIGNKEVVVSGRIFTGNGPEASGLFGRKLIELLSTTK